jgi:predicted enzyme related to lactoylglutathione lyase
MDWRLELVQVPVSDVDRAKEFYAEKAGFDADVAEPGSLQGLQLVVDDIEAARSELSERGVDVSDVHEFDWGKFVYFNDPDGNGWAVQQLPPRD